MSPLTDRNAHLFAVPLHGLPHRQPEKRGKINNNNDGNNHSREKDGRSKIEFLTLMTGFQKSRSQLDLTAPVFGCLLLL